MRAIITSISVGQSGKIKYNHNEWFGRFGLKSMENAHREAFCARTRWFGCVFSISVRFGWLPKCSFFVGTQQKISIDRNRYGFFVCAIVRVVLVILAFSQHDSTGTHCRMSSMINNNRVENQVISLSTLSAIGMTENAWLLKPFSNWMRERNTLATPNLFV